MTTATRARPVSALYEGWVDHHRPGPPSHGFRARSTMVLLDLDELDDVLGATPLWSSRRWAPVRFRRRDYLDGTDRPLADALAELVEARTARRPTGPMRMLTQLRRLGWLFNPISLYWCDAPDGTADTVVLEVTNTPWHERHWYVLDARHPGEFAKELHVSPFLPMDLSYRLRIDSSGAADADPRPGAGPDPQRPARLDVGLQARHGDQPVFDAHLALARIELTPVHAVATLLRRPLATVGVSAGIQRQAGALWAKRVPFHHHPVRGHPDRGHPDRGHPDRGRPDRGPAALRPADELVEP